jgi:fibronectin type 3 domain-containing protein
LWSPSAQSICLITATIGGLLQAQTPPVPPEYADLDTAMRNSINVFNQSILADWDGSKPPVIFSGHLQTVNSNGGTAILGNTDSLLIELNGLKALGVTGVVLNIDFPVLDPNFDAWGGQSANFLGFYQNVVNEIRARNLKVIVESGAIFTDPAFSHWPLVADYYQSLSIENYRSSRAQQALVIAQQLQPDYLNVVQEPDTEANQTGKPELKTLTGSLELLNTILGTLRPTVTTVQIGAGIGTWLPTDSEGKTAFDYIEAYAATSVDSIDMHVYPVILDFLPRMTTIASMAKSAQKKVTITEAWAYKQRESEAGDPAFTPAVLYSRDVYSFWYPRDIQFLTAMVNFSFWQQLEFMVATWDGYFRAYLTFDEITCCLPPEVLFDLVHAAQSEQMQIGAYAATGKVWEDLIVVPPDTEPPTPPVVACTAYPTQVALNWNWPYDNIGVAKFIVSRSGMTPVTTVQTVFQELGLLDGKTYTYTVTAYDAENNYAPVSTPCTTPDVTPPTAPTSVAANPVSSTSIRVTWSGATDNVGVTFYNLFRSANGGAFVPLPEPFPSTSPYTDTAVQSSTSYCYYVIARDEAGFASPPSPTACTCTPDTRPPTVPTGVTATGITPPTIIIIWNPSSDGEGVCDTGVAAYKIQRRLNGGPPVVIATGITTTSYLDQTAVVLPDTAAPNTSVVTPTAGATVSGTIVFRASASDLGVTTRYTYQVAAYDLNGNTSVGSAAASKAWPKNTSGIAGVRFFVDGVQVKSQDTTSPYYIQWDTRTVGNGTHTLTVIASDNAGNSKMSAPVGITVNN